MINDVSSQSWLIKNTLWLGLLIIIVISTSLLYHYASLGQIQTFAIDTQTYVNANPLHSWLLFSLFYLLICALPMPFISVFTMLAGYFFGNSIGLLTVSFMSAIGGSLLFMMVRYCLREQVQQWLANHKNSHYLHEAANTDSFTVALSIRFIPAMPFPIPAIALALSQLSLWKFYLSTQLGLLITLFVYVNAGHRLTEVDSINDVLSPPFILSMLALAIVPLGFKVLQNSRK